MPAKERISVCGQCPRRAAGGGHEEALVCARACYWHVCGASAPCGVRTLAARAGGHTFILPRRRTPPHRIYRRGKYTADKGGGVRLPPSTPRRRLMLRSNCRPRSCVVWRTPERELMAPPANSPLHTAYDHSSAYERHEGGWKTVVFECGANID